MRITFPSDMLQLEGTLTAPSNCKGAAVICHPHPLYGGNMDNNVVLALEQGLQRGGFATLRFNFRGVDGSEGGYEGGRGETEDVRAAVAAALQHTGLSLCTLAGYSFGAMMVVLTGDRIDEVDRLIIVAPPLSFARLDSLASCAKPKLFLAGTRDQYCDAGDLEAAVARLPEPRRVEIVAGADHFLAGHEKLIADAVVAFNVGGSSETSD